MVTLLYFASLRESIRYGLEHRAAGVEHALPLGRGLDALLSTAPEPAGEASALQNIAIDRIRPGKYQPRTRMDEGALYELAESIKAQGVMQPVLVRPVGTERFEIIASKPHGDVDAVLQAMRRLDFAALLSSRPCREADLVMGMVAARIVAPRCSSTRWPSA